MLALQKSHRNIVFPSVPYLTAPNILLCDFSTIIKIKKSTLYNTINQIIKFICISPIFPLVSFFYSRVLSRIPKRIFYFFFNLLWPVIFVSLSLVFTDLTLFEEYWSVVLSNVPQSGFFSFTFSWLGRLQIDIVGKNAAEVLLCPSRCLLSWGSWCCYGLLLVILSWVTS